MGQDSILQMSNFCSYINSLGHSWKRYPRWWISDIWLFHQWWHGCGQKQLPRHSGRIIRWSRGLA